MNEYGLKYFMRRIWYHLTIRNKPLAVHTEAIFIDEVWEEIKKRVLNKEVYTWYVMTPANYDYFKGSFGIKKSKKEISDIMKKRYLWMEKNGQKIELHVHLAMLMNISYEEQKKLIGEGYNWMKKELGISPEEVVFGWWEYNEDSLKIIRELGLNHIKQNDYASTHDYNWVGR